MRSLRRAGKAVLNDVASRICDDTQVNWAHVDGLLDNAADKRLLAALNIIARVAEVSQGERASERLRRRPRTFRIGALD
jgi:hypothetical protein